MARVPRPYSKASERCVNAKWITSKETGERIRIICRQASCSRECFDAQARWKANALIPQFLANPPSHMLRLTVQDEISDDEIEKRIKSLCRRLKYHGCTAYAVGVHFRDGRRHDHIVVLYEGDAKNPEALFRDLIDRAFSGVSVTRYAEPRKKEPPALARYLVQDLKFENKRDVELPPDGVKGLHLLRRSGGYNVKPRKEQVEIYAMPEDFPVVRESVGEQDGVAISFDLDALGRAGLAGGPPQGERGASTPAPEVRSDDPTLTEPPNAAKPASSAAATSVESNRATDNSGWFSLAQEREDELRCLLESLSAQRAAPRDGMLYDYEVFGLVNSWVDGGMIDVIETVDALVDRGVLLTPAPKRFVLARLDDEHAASSDADGPEHSVSA